MGRDPSHSFWKRAQADQEAGLEQESEEVRGRGIRVWKRGSGALEGGGVPGS